MSGNRIIKCPYCGKDIELKKEQKPKKISPIGYDALQYIIGEDCFTANFRFKGGMDLGEEDMVNFNEQAIFRYLASAYANSCLTLLSELEKYRMTDDIYEKKRIATRYMPAIFCFRHFIELKLKGLYIYINQELPDNIHDIKELIKNIEKEIKTELVAFRKALDYIKGKESGSQTFFRYLSKSQNKFVDSLKFNVQEFGEIRKMISEIMNSDIIIKKMCEEKRK